MLFVAVHSAFALAATLLASPPPPFDCVFFDSPPTPSCGGVLNVEVGQLLTFTVQASDHTCRLPISLDAALLEIPGATTVPPLPMTGSPVSCVVSWVPDITNVGPHSIVFHAVSGCCQTDAWCNLVINVTNTPPCPPCVDARFGLGAAGSCTVLELGSGHVTVSGPSGVHGDACIEPGGRLETSGSSFVTGDVRLAPGATFTHSGTSWTGEVLTNVNLRPEINAAMAASSALSALPCSQDFPTWSTTRTISGNGGLNVICVTDVHLGGGNAVTLIGSASDRFVIKVTGRFELSAGSQIVVSGGVQAKDVVCEILGHDHDVVLSGGSSVDGTLLAPQRRIRINDGIVRGEVISGRDINISSGARVRCPECR